MDQRDRAAATYHLHQSESRVLRSGRAALRSLQQLLRIEHLTTTLGPRRTLHELRSSARVTFEPTLFVELRRAQEVQLLVSSGMLGQARALVESHPRTPHLLPAIIELELATGDLFAARRALDGWDHQPEPRPTIERLLGTVAVLSAEGKREPAEIALRDALDRAEPELLRQPFLAHPAVMRILLHEAQRDSQTFARSILQVAAAEQRRDSQEQLIEPLTDREREILDYLPTRLPNTEIAAHLYVSVNTLKSHLRHIYAKLAATNRDEAVTRARSLGLL